MNQLMMVTKSRRYKAIVHKTLFSRFRMELHSVHVHLTLLWDSSSLWFHLRHLTHSSFTVFAKSHTPLATLKQMLAPCSSYKPLDQPHVPTQLLVL